MFGCIENFVSRLKGNDFFVTDVFVEKIFVGLVPSGEEFVDYVEFGFTGFYGEDEFKDKDVFVFGWILLFREDSFFLMRVDYCSVIFIFIEYWIF